MHTNESVVNDQTVPLGAILSGSEMYVKRTLVIHVTAMFVTKGFAAKSNLLLIRNLICTHLKHE